MKEIKKMGKILITLLNFLIPPICPICHKRTENIGLCPECFSKLEFIGTQKCSICGQPLDALVPGLAICGRCLKEPPYFHQAEAVFKYNDIIKKLILPFKHSNHIELTELFVKWMSSNSYEMISKNEILVPVPLNWKRLLKRKYNQSALLAQRLAKTYKKAYAPLTLKRVKFTKSQGHLSPKDRKKNVTGVFIVKYPEQIQGKSILLIDDVFTTGATVNECAKILLKSGAKSVDVLTIAKVVKN